MSNQTKIDDNSLTAFTDNEKAAFSNALSVHYIVMVLYAIGTVGASTLLLIALFTSYTHDSILRLSIFSVPPILFSLHLLAVIGLKKSRRWGYNASRALGYFLLLIFPFGTVLGVLLLMQLSRFNISGSD